MGLKYKAAIYHDYNTYGAAKIGRASCRERV